MTSQKKSLSIHGEKIMYWEKNHEESAVIVLLHGFPGNHAGLVDLANNIKGYRLLIPDLPASGESEPLSGNHCLENYADWVSHFLESLSIDSAVIVGHSFGARVALMFGAKYPQKVLGLALITPVVRFEGLIVRIVSLKGMIAKLLPNSLRKSWLASAFYHRLGHTIVFKSSGPKKRRQMLEADYKELKNLNVQATIDIFDEFYHADLVSLAQKMKADILLIAGDKDRIATFSSLKEFASKLQKVSLEVMENSGHLVPLEKPLATAKIIESWLHKVT